MIYNIDDNYDIKPNPIINIYQNLTRSLYLNQPYVKP